LLTMWAIGAASTSTPILRTLTGIPSFSKASLELRPRTMRFTVAGLANSKENGKVLFGQADVAGGGCRPCAP
jgi:hypothetical protein